ncbi:MAG: hypothetical protein CSA62_00470 [Planctomycetota bacterium]|nr:MAG: hypothetical protein CSA62_00470 [Planctomycetota bacterium]
MSRRPDFGSWVLGAFFLMAGALSAQSSVSYSPSYALGQVNSNNVIPFTTQSMRYQQIHDSWTFSSQRPILIRGIRYRPSGQKYHFNKKGGTVEVRIDMAFATIGITSMTASRTLDKNLDKKTLKTVFKRKKVSYPPSGKAPDEQKHFNISFPFDSAILFLYQPGLQRSLVIETRQYSHIGGYAFDFVMNKRVAGNGFAVSNGSYKGCANTHKYVARLEANASALRPGGSFSFTGTYDKPKVLSYFCLGSQGLSLKMPPTSCYIMNDLVWGFAGLTDSSHRFSIKAPLPNSPSLADLRFLAQVYFIEPDANVLGIVSTRSLSCGIGRGAAQKTLGLRRFWITGNPDTVKVSSYGLEQGLVMMFHN